MKKQLNKRLFLVSLFLLIALLLTGCSCSHKNAYIRDQFDATCAEQGYTGDLYCEDCDTVLEIGVLTEMIEHSNIYYIKGYSSNCTEDGYTGEGHCGVCHALVDEGQSIPATGHQAQEGRANALTVSCERDGYTGDIRCVNCSEVLEAGEVIPATGHTPGEPTKAREATCTEDGRTGEIRCVTCNKVLQENETIAAAGHVPGEPVGAKPATCKATGLSGATYCTVCNDQLSENLRTQALGHEVVNTNCEEEKLCSRCNEMVPGFSHSYTVATQTEAATCSECGHVWGEPLMVPFYCNGEVLASAEHLCAAEVLDKYFTEETYNLREDPEAVDYYMSTERVATLYDDGTDVLLTSKTGFYFGTVVDDTTTRLYALLETDLGIENSKYSYISLTTYKSPNGYWIIDNQYQIYIDTVNEKLYYMNTGKKAYFPCMSDRYVLFNQGDSLLIMDRDTCQAQLLPFQGLDDVPYFDGDGVAILQVNSAYSVGNRTDAEDYRKYNTHYYYTWNNAGTQLISYGDYPYVVYADNEAIMVEKEFSFDKIVNGEEVWSIKKKELNQTSSRKFAFQSGVLWQYGNLSSYFFTYLVPEEQPLLTYALGAPETEDIDEAYRVGWSSRFTDCHNYDYTDHSIDHMCVFDHVTMKLHLLNKYHRSHRIYNQSHVLWDSCLVNGMEGRYGVYFFEDGTYFQRNLTK